MGTIMKMGLGLVLFVIVLTSLLGSAFKDIGKIVTDVDDKYKKHLGEKYIIDKDTLTVIDYSLISENFILSDGRKVHYTLIRND